LYVDGDKFTVNFPFLVEKKRIKRMRKAGKEELEVETYDSLVGYSMCGQCGYNQTSLKVIDKKTYVDV
jgi:hypothetical protein